MNLRVLFFHKKIINTIQLAFLLQNCMAGAAGITYQFSGGRFGDNLLAYLHAKWFSMQYQIPLYYRPFPQSDKLRLHVLELPIDRCPCTSMKQLTKEDMSIDPNQNCLYIVPYFSEFQYERTFPHNKNWINVAIDWNNQNFRQEIRKLIKSLYDLSASCLIPSDVISVAVHIRKNDGQFLSDAQMPVGDPSPYVDYKQLLRFPPESFYIEQIINLSNIFRNKQLYVYLFTDVNDPIGLLEHFKNQIKANNINFDCRMPNQIADDNFLIEDFFAITQFDCLIRSQSNFSYVASLISNYIIEIYPSTAEWQQIDNNRWQPNILKTTIKLGRNLNFDVTQ